MKKRITVPTLLIFLILATQAWARPHEIDETVALIEQQFPVRENLEVNPSQFEWLQNNEISIAVSSSFYPSVGDANREEGQDIIELFGQHGKQSYLAYVAGRTSFPKPFLLNLSSTLPQAIEFLIQKGVRIFSFSIGVRDFDWVSLRKVLEDNPEVIFIASTPHIDGSSIPVSDLKETPSRYALTGLPNLILAGALEYYRYHLKEHHEGKRLGTSENPFVIDNQPAQGASQFFMMTPASTQVFAEKFGGTSAAAPVLASLISLTITRLKEAGVSPTRENILLHLERLLHVTTAVEKDLTLQIVRYFTLDTALANFDLSLQTEKTWWGGYSDHPQPIRFQDIVLVADKCSSLLSEGHKPDNEGR